MYVSAIHSTHKNAGSPRVSTGLRAGPILRSSLRICGSMLAAERKCREDMEIKGHEVLAPQVSMDKKPGPRWDWWSESNRWDMMGLLKPFMMREVCLKLHIDAAI